MDAEGRVYVHSQEHRSIQHASRKTYALDEMYDNGSNQEAQLGQKMSEKHLGMFGSVTCTVYNPERPRELDNGWRFPDTNLGVMR